VLNIEYNKTEKEPNRIHNEFQLLTEGVADSLPTDSLLQKIIDSLVGFNGAGNPVPDPALPAKQKYGLSFRPIQTIFIDRAKALKIAIDRINGILLERPFTDLANKDYFYSSDPIPNSVLNLYDIGVDTLIDLSQVGTVRLRKAILSVNIVDGRIDTVDIIDTGFGYRTPPPVKITGDGVNAEISVELDNQGQISKVNVLSRGRNYTSANLELRSFSVLVRNDSSINGFWSIYSWDQDRKEFFKNIIQS
jgi:hypothetical protein